jgi:hypothetical protein
MFIFNVDRPLMGFSFGSDEGDVVKFKGKEELVLLFYVKWLLLFIIIGSLVSSPHPLTSINNCLFFNDHILTLPSNPPVIILYGHFNYFIAVIFVD